MAKTAVTPMERVRWAREVVQLRGDGKTWAEVASHTGMSQAKCRRLEKGLRESGDPEAPSDPWAWVWRRMDTLTVVMDEASATYEAAPAGSSARVGALKLFGQASADILDLAASAGLLPRNLRVLAAERELQQVFRDFAHLLREHDAPDEMLAALLRLAESRLTATSTVETRPALPAA